MNEENAKHLLFDVDGVLNNAGLHYCLGSGTLLGAIREDRFIPIDQDIDLWARAEEFEPLVPKIVTLMRSLGLKTEVIDHRHAGYWDGRDYAIKFSGYGEHGDLTAFTKMPGNFRYNPTHASKEPFCIVFSEEVCIWTPRDFYGKLFYVPQISNQILTQLYDDWETPDTEYDQPCVHRAYKPNFLTKQDVAYVAMCLDVLHPGHLNILRHAKRAAKTVWVGLLTDEAINLYKNTPILNYQARHEIASELSMVTAVVRQEDYLTSLLKYKPAYVVHGDDWKKGPQIASRQLVLDLLPHWGGKLVEVPYTPGYSSSALKERIRDTKS